MKTVEHQIIILCCCIFTACTAAMNLQTCCNVIISVFHNMKLILHHGLGFPAQIRGYFFVSGPERGPGSPLGEQVAHPTLLSLRTKMWSKMPDAGHLFGEFSWQRIKKILFSERI